MKKLLGGLVLSISMLAGTAQADVAKMYFGVGVSDGSMEVGADDDMSVGSINATLGLQLLDFVGVELEAGSASDQTGSVLSDPLFTYQAAMLRLGYRWDRAGIYLLGGQARLEVEQGVNVADTENVMGFGINLFGNETTSLNLHVLRFADGELRTTTIGFQHYFGGFR